MPCYKSAAEWAVAQFRREDWVTRHHLMARLRVNRPTLWGQIMDMMSPDEALDGRDTMRPTSGRVALVMKNRMKPKPTTNLVQTKITKYFRRVSVQP